jgi:hypothetical protein
MPQTLPGSSSANPRSQSFRTVPSRCNSPRARWRSRLLEVALSTTSSQVPAADRIKLDPPRVYQNHQTCVGKRLSRIRTDESNPNLASNSSAPSVPSFVFGRTPI